MVVLNHEKVAVNIPVKSNFDSNSSIVEVVVTKYFRNVVHAFEPRFEKMGLLSVDSVVPD